MKAKYFFGQVKKINEAERTIDVIASTIDKDRDGDIILPSAFKKTLKSFKDNPVILSGHQHRLPTGSSPVIGSAIPETIEITDKDLRFTMRFADTDKGREHWTLYKDKHQRAFSVGFIPQKSEDVRDDNGRYSHTVFTQVELLEVSAVPVPSNPRALARAKGYFEDEDRESMEASIGERIETQVAACFKQLQSDVEGLIDDVKSILIPDSHRFAKTLLGEIDDSDVCTGDNEKAERIVKILKELLNN